MIRRSVFVYVVVVVLLFSGILLPEILGATRQDYSSFANYLSELGATGTSTQHLTNTLAFPMVGISCILIMIALWHRLPKLTGLRAGLICLGLGLPAGYFGAAIFPCDYGCPIEGSINQSVHNLLGLVQYPLGVIGFALLSVNLKSKPMWRMLCAIAAAAMAIGFVMMLVPDQADFRGAWQRLSDYPAFLVLCYIVLSSQPKRKTS
ncbi:MAG: DUF998 domain-containing protein [Litorimonas sp.]